MSTPDLGSVVTNATLRKYIYGTYTVALVLAGATQVGYGAGNEPEWLTVALRVLAYLGALIGGLALANTGNTPAVVNNLVGSNGRHEAENV
jgi:hypothetical protein